DDRVLQRKALRESDGHDYRSAVKIFEMLHGHQRSSLTRLPLSSPSFADRGELFVSGLLFVKVRCQKHVNCSTAEFFRPCNHATVSGNFVVFLSLRCGEKGGV